MNEQDARKVLEAVLFSSSGVVAVKQLARIIGNFRVANVRGLADALNSEYERTNRTFRIVRIGDGLQMRTLPMYSTWIQKAEPSKPVRLSPPSLETLANDSIRDNMRCETKKVRIMATATANRPLSTRYMFKKEMSPSRGNSATAGEYAGSSGLSSKVPSLP